MLKAEYDERCEDLIRGFKTSLPGTGDARDQQNETFFIVKPPDLSMKPTRTLGPYKNCVHHYSGLFSSIYLTPSPFDPPRILAIKLTTPGNESLPHNSKREARILRSCVHMNIIKLLETHQIPNSSDFLLVYPFQPLTLTELLSSTTLVASSVLRDIFSALAFIHEQGVIHRDIKPTNVLLSSVTGPALLADFGIAWSRDDPASETAAAKITDIGTTCYRAPELLFGNRCYNEAVDLWAAGCLVAEVFMHNAEPAKGNEWTLFDAGELGSELALVKSIFETLGTPDERTWPETKDLPDWGKMTFIDFPAKGWEAILPKVAGKGKDIVKGLVQYESKWRTRPEKVERQLSLLGGQA